MEPPILEASNKGKKKPPNFYGFHTFAEPGFPISLRGPFRDNIRQFLQECAKLEEYNVEGMPVWCTFLVLENRGLVLPLYTIEENVKKSAKPFCDPCRCAGKRKPLRFFRLNFELGYDFELEIVVFD